MGWTDRFLSSSNKEEEPPRRLLDYVDITPEARQKLGELKLEHWTVTDTQKAALAVLGTISFAAGFKAGRFQNPWRRFTQTTDIPSHYFGDTAVFLRGRVLSVSDGDTIRFRHTPSFFQSSTLREDEKLSAVALPIRICTIDTPETAKFGKPGQPFGEEAKEYLKRMVENKIVYCQLLQQDQYGRAVAQVKVGRWPFTNYVDDKMLKAGLAEVYLGSGAVYGHKGKEAYLALMEKAKKNKTGMWSQKNRETAAEYKARLK